MTGAAFDRIVAAFENQGLAVAHKGGGQAAAQAPGHSMADRSISLRAIEGQVLINSHSDPKEQVLDALGLTLADLFDSPTGEDYRYSDGRVKHRSPSKQFTQSGNTKGPGVLYRLDRLRDATVVHWAEGEKDVHALESVGAVATTTPSTSGSLPDLSVLHGKAVVLWRDKDEAGRKYVDKIVQALADKANVNVVEAKIGKDAADHVAAGYGLDDFIPIAQAQELSVVRLSDVVAERVSWLWPNRIPAGKLVTLDGDPSLGKSTLALTFGAVITNGGTWPDGSRCEYQGDVILLSAEDGLADTVRPRLDAAGADVRRVHAVQGVTLEDGTLRPPTLADVDRLQRLVVRTGARLLVVDVLMAYLPSGTDSHKDQDIRRVLSRLSALADTTGCTVLLLRHLNKAKGGDPMYRGGGSIGIVGAARAGMLVARDPDDEDVRVLASTKSNLGPPPDALTYRLVNVDELGVARVEWIGTSTHDARALLSDSDEGDGEERREVEVWLEDLLSTNGAALSAADVFKSARAAGYSNDQAKRAKKKLGVTSTKAAMGSGWVWNLPEGSSEGSEESTSQKGTPFAPFVPPSAPAKVERTVIPIHRNHGSAALAPATDPIGTAVDLHICSICSEPCQPNIRAHLDCVTSRWQTDNFGYLPHTEGSEVGVWIGSGRPVTSTEPHQGETR